MARGSIRKRGDRSWQLVYDLPRSHASLLLGEGEPMHVVQFYLGHQSITTTVDIYGHVMKEADLVAAENFARIVSLAEGADEVL